MSKTVDAWIDETGEKALVRNLTEKDDAHFALVVALPVPTAHAHLVNDSLRPPFARFAATAPAGAKLHITDAFASGNTEWREAAESARKEIFDVVKSIDARIVYGARRFRLSRLMHADLENLGANARNALAKSHPQIAIPSHPSDGRVEAEAYQTLMMFLDAMGKDEDLIITPRCDYMVKAMADSFSTALREAQSVSKSTHVVKAFDKLNKQRLEPSFDISASIPSLNAAALDITQIQVGSIERTIGPELFAVDVIANSLAYHLRALPSDAALHGPEATAGWIAATQVFGSNHKGLAIDDF